MAIVTISRVIGSGGDKISAQVADQLGYELVDNALLEKVAERAGVSIDDVIDVDEKYESKIFELLKKLVDPQMGKIKILTTEGAHLDPETYVEYCKTVISGIAESGNAVIVGRGGQFVLQDNETAFHVRIIADYDFRMNSLMERRGISEREAADLIKKSDYTRMRYIERYLDEDWDDQSAYHLVIDSSRLGIDLTSSVISDAVAKFSEIYDYIPGVRERRNIDDRRDAQRRSLLRRSDVSDMTQKEVTHTVMREGRLPRSYTKPDRRKKSRRDKARRAAEKSE